MGTQEHISAPRDKSDPRQAHERPWNRAGAGRDRVPYSGFRRADGSLADP
jgi:hypothetical protein